MTECSERIRGLLIDGDLTKPVLANCTRADVAAVLGSGGTDGSGKLSGKPRTWLKYAEAKQHGKVRAWFDDSDHLLMLVVMTPRMKAPMAQLLSGLGKAEAELDSRSQNMTDDHLVRDHIFAAKGITLSLGKPFRDKGEHVVFTAYYYVPTTADVYVSNLGGKDQWVRKFPRR